MTSPTKSSLPLTKPPTGQLFCSTAEKQGLSIGRFNRIPFSVSLPSKKHKFVSSGS